MRRRGVLLPALFGVFALGPVCAQAGLPGGLSDIHITPPTLTGRSGGDGTPRRQSNISVTMPQEISQPAPVTPAQPTAQQAAQQAAQQEAQRLYSEGRAAAYNKDWQKAIECFLKALDICDNKDIRDALKAAKTCLAYEKYLQAAEKERGETLVGMSDCLCALSAALADLNSSVACNKMARTLQSGAEAEFPAEDVLTDASVVDLRDAKLGIVAMEKLQSPYAKEPPPVFASGPNRLSDQQMAQLAECLVNCEAGRPVSERQIEELLGIPPIDHPDGPPETLQTEHGQIHAALDRFSDRLVKGCNEALAATLLEFQKDPVTQTIRAVAAHPGTAAPPELMELWNQNLQEVHQRLFERFRMVQDAAVDELGMECTLVFKQSAGSPAKNPEGGR
jgi:hypothetical protein